jgi:hypothetical protein
VIKTRFVSRLDQFIRSRSGTLIKSPEQPNNSKEENDMSNPNNKEITVTFVINEQSGKLVNMNKGGGSNGGGPGEGTEPEGKITDTVTFLVSHNSPACIYVLIAGNWYRFC